MGGDDDGIGPGEALRVLAGAVATHRLRPGGDEAHLVDAVVVALQRVAAAGGGADGADVDDLRVVGADDDVAALAAAGEVAVAPGDAGVVDAAGHGQAGVVLLRAVDVVRIPGVGGEVIELGGRLVEDRRPGGAAVDGDVGAAVVALDHAAGIRGVDPEVVVVAVRGGDLGEGLAAVAALPELEVVDVDRVGVPRVGGEVDVVPGAGDQVLLVGDFLPVVAVVVGAVEAALLGVLDQGPDAAGPGRRGGDADLAQGAGGQVGAAADVLPGLAAVDAAPEAAAGAAAADLPEGAVGLPGGRIEEAGIGLVDGEVDGAGFVADGEDVPPGGAAVVALEDAALRVRPEGVAEGGHPDDVRVVGVDADLADLAGLAQAGVAPGAAGVGAAVDAVAVGDVGADGRLAGAGVDHVGVGRGDGQRSHRGGGEEAVGDGAPVRAAVGRLPDAAGHRAEVVGRRVVGDAGDGDHAATAERADAPPLEQTVELELPRIRHQSLPSLSLSVYRP